MVKDLAKDRPPALLSIVSAGLNPDRGIKEGCCRKSFFRLIC